MAAAICVTLDGLSLACDRRGMSATLRVASQCAVLGAWLGRLTREQAEYAAR
jgi:hypothetical protein